MPHVFAYIDDIFFQAKLSGTAKQLGIELRICTSPETLAAELASGTPSLAVIDLNARNNPIGAIEYLRARASSVPTVAYLSHIQVELAERAKAAGCGEVMPRSKFTRDLATILARAKSEAA